MVTGEGDVVVLENEGWIDIISTRLVHLAKAAPLATTRP
jgi:hypothetical protein